LTYKLVHTWSELLGISRWHAEVNPHVALPFLTLWQAELLIFITAHRYHCTINT